MTDDAACRIELSIEIDAPIEAVWKALTEARELANWFPPEAGADGSGLGSVLTLSWGEGMTFAVRVVAHEEGKHLRWMAEGEGAPPLVTDFHLATTAGGKTVLRLVHSGFGPGDEWDEMIKGLDTGWRYFLHHLRVYLEEWAPRVREVRQMISQRLPSAATRERLWRHLTTGAGGLLLGGAGALALGQRYEVQLSDSLRTPGVVEVVAEGRAFALRLPALGEAMLFVEIESGTGELTTGFWLSVHDRQWAEQWRFDVQRQFQRVIRAASSG
jgi:uncharacterized protein YndB with AHSA1/START domain